MPPVKRKPITNKRLCDLAIQLNTVIVLLCKVKKVDYAYLFSTVTNMTPEERKYLHIVLPGEEA